jgi:hypothetical protein
LPDVIAMDEKPIDSPRSRGSIGVLAKLGWADGPMR